MLVFLEEKQKLTSNLQVFLGQHNVSTCLVRLNYIKILGKMVVVNKKRARQGDLPRPGKLNLFYISLRL